MATLYSFLPRNVTTRRHLIQNAREHRTTKSENGKFHGSRSVANNWSASGSSFQLIVSQKVCRLRARPVLAQGVRNDLLDEQEGQLLGHAPTESWFNSCKNERIHGLRYATHADMKAAAFEYIEVFYNRNRQHSTLGYRSPIQHLDRWMREQNLEKQAA